MVHHPVPDDGTPGGESGLTTGEDRELRQLTWFGKAGDLSEKSRGRIDELGGRDRRSGVRDPRPNPSSPGDDDPPSRLPRLEMDRSASVTCPNCGSLLPWSREHSGDRGASKG